MSKIKSKLFKFSLVCLLFFIAYFVASLPFDAIYSLPNQMFITENEIIEANENQMFGKYLYLDLEDNVCPVSSFDNQNYNAKLSIKLLNLITIREIDVNVSLISEIKAGGNALGFSLKCNGVILVAFNDVITDEGSVNPFKNSLFAIGDRLVQINDKGITSMNDIDNFLIDENYKGEPLNLVGYRQGELITCEVVPQKEMGSGRYKLGVWVREDATGVGTLTYIRGDNGRFGALGHGISENESEDYMKISGGNIYNCDIIGVNKGAKGHTGELRGLFVAGKNEQGIIEKNNKYGVFGVIDEKSILNNNKTYKIGGRLTAKPGKAQILCCTNGSTIEAYDIEIIKTNFQKNSNDRSMVLRVTDQRLLEKTGGIVQGMSGSPIVQEDKIIGAVTHVFVNDPTKGFGIYLDWMLNN